MNTKHLDSNLHSPAVDIDSVALPQAASALTGKTSPLILIVGGDNPMRTTLNQAMQQEGYQVVEAADLEQCLALYSHCQPNLVLISAMMPLGASYTCCRQLQTLPGGSCTPVLMISDLDDGATVEQIFAVGAADYVTAPIRLVVLRERVRRLLQPSQLMRKLYQQRQQERLLRTITFNIRQSLNLDEILNTSVTEVRAFLNVDRVALYQINAGQGGNFVVESVAAGWTSLLGTSLIDPCFDLEYAERYRQGRVAATDNIHQSGLPACYIELLAQIEVRANLIVPIVYEDELWGLLCAHQCSGSRHWEAFEIELLLQMANQMAIAIQQSKLYQELAETNQRLERLVCLDSLTQVANRRRFDQYLAQEWQRLARESLPLALILADIDHFKPYNDTYGHQAGDYCLQQVAIALGEVVKRPADLIARYGGEEFAVILPNTGTEGALQVAEAIRAKVRTWPLSHPCHQAGESVTLSLGVASTLPQATGEPATLIAAADQALYQAKAQGRDSVQVASETRL